MSNVSKLNRRQKKFAAGIVHPDEAGELEGERQKAHRSGRYVPTRGSGVREGYDTFDAILEHLIAEGYADTNESALAIMANMSEEWREEILDEARVDDGKSKEDKRKIRTARAGRAGVNLPNSSLHTGDIDRRHAHRTTDDLNKDARDIRRGRLNLPQFQGTTGRERVAQVKKEKGIR